MGVHPAACIVRSTLRGCSICEEHQVARKRCGDIWGLCFHFCPARCSGHKRPPLGYAGCARNRDLQRQPLGSTGARSAQMPRDALNTMPGMNFFPTVIASPVRSGKLGGPLLWSCCLVVDHSLATIPDLRSLSASPAQQDHPEPTSSSSRSPPSGDSADLT